MDKPEVWCKFGDKVHSLGKTPFYRRHRAEESSDTLPDFTLEVSD